MKYIIILLTVLLTSCQQPAKQEKQEAEGARPMALPSFQPKNYVCYRTQTPLILDGQLDETAWQNAPWTDDFLDIEGEAKEKPLYRTRVKMLWDDQYFYVAAELEEPHIWATLTERDAVIFIDNDFEVFIDPDGDTHGYYEYEVNAFNTVWDLVLVKPYREGGPAINNWDINGLKSAVHVDGTVNDPSDTDRKWTIEVAFPHTALNEFNPYHSAKHGRQWRVNFSRVQWQATHVDGVYKKTINPETGKSYREDNWVWSPQGVIDMHRPELWGMVQFSDVISGQGTDTFTYHPDEEVKWELYTLYHAQKAWYKSNGQYTTQLSQLSNVGIASFAFNPVVEVTQSLFEARASRKESAFIWHIDQSGRTWKSKK